MSSDLQREHGCKSFHKVVRPPFLNNSTSEDWNKSAVQPCNEMWDLYGCYAFKQPKKTPKSLTHNCTEEHSALAFKHYFSVWYVCVIQRHLSAPLTISQIKKSAYQQHWCDNAVSSLFTRQQCKPEHCLSLPNPLSDIFLLIPHIH